MESARRNPGAVSVNHRGERHAEGENTLGPRQPLVQTSRLIYHSYRPCCLFLHPEIHFSRSYTSPGLPLPKLDDRGATRATSAASRQRDLIDVPALRPPDPDMVVLRGAAVVAPHRGASRRIAQ